MGAFINLGFSPSVVTPSNFETNGTLGKKLRVG